MSDNHAISLFRVPSRTPHSIAYKVLNRRRTDATPLVLVHGLSAVGTVDWMPLAQGLAKTRPVVVFDNRGMGNSTLPAGAEPDWGMDAMANDVVELVKHLGYKKIDLLGFSMGGMIAQVVALTPRLPFSITHLILAATSLKPAHSDLLQAFPSPEESARAKTLEEKKKLVTPLIHNQDLLNRRITESVSARRPSRVILQQMDAISKYNVRARLPSLHVAKLPVLSIHGKLDRSVFYSEFAYIQKALPNIVVAKTPTDQFGHTWYDYFGTEFWEGVIGDFLDGKPQRDLAAGEPKSARL
ncbi:hypothetical protein MNV49_003765 [Pseudohyphozyma bogoriensis]|nr:hypothetical protein MNV49_003765 [Pseudohyphozyma bogoriensis]